MFKQMLVLVFALAALLLIFVGMEIGAGNLLHGKGVDPSFCRKAEGLVGVNRSHFILLKGFGPICWLVKAPNGKQMRRFDENTVVTTGLWPLGTLEVYGWGDRRHVEWCTHRCKEFTQGRFLDTAGYYDPRLDLPDDGGSD